MIVDEDTYMENIERSKALDVEKLPKNKVPAINLQKLAFERKNVPITVPLGMEKIVAGHPGVGKPGGAGPLRLGPQRVPRPQS